MSRFPSFDEFFTALWNDEPFPWQRRLAASVLDAGWPRAMSLPTGAGKTSVVDVWVWALAAGAAGDGPRQPRRLFFVIDRRIVVDSVFDRAAAIARALREANVDPLAAVGSTLLGLGGSQPLLAARLRGGLEIDRAWAESLAQPLVCATTVDQVGSRLLFRGYGLPHRRRNSLPIHAALVGNDALLVVDEAHLSAPFDETLTMIRRLRSMEPDLGLPWHCLRMTATPRPESGAPFALDAADEDDERLRRRLQAPKPSRLVDVPARRNRDAIAEAAGGEASLLLADEALRTIGVVVNRVARARAIADALRERRLDADVLLLIGPSRPLERDQAVADALPRLRAGRARTADSRRLVVVATQTIEVGADLDFDALVTECASADSLRQRFGRLDRLGDLNGGARAVVLYSPASGDDPVYGTAVEPAWRWLQQQAVDGVVDVGPQALAEPPAAALAPVAHAPLLFPAYLDRLVQTSPLPAPEPAVSVFLHGFDSRPPDVEIVWRADLDPAHPERWPEVVALAPPSGLEAVRVGFAAARRWLNGLPPADIADVEGGAEEQAEDGASATARVLRWRGARDDATMPIDAGELRPGDTIVVSASKGGCDDAGWAPALRAPVDDLVERVALAQRKPLLRLHPLVLANSGLDPQLARDLLVPDEDDAAILVPDRDAVARLVAEIAEGESPLADAARALSGGEYRILLYPGNDGVIVAASDDAPALDDDEGELAGVRTDVLLRDHQDGVAREALRTATAVGLDERLGRALAAAAARHDEGKRDPRFQRVLAGGSSIHVGEPLAKERVQVRDRASQRRAWRESGLPSGFRHEAASVAVLDGLEEGLDAELVAHLVASHHGCARPYFPIVEDASPWVDVSELQRVDGEVPERFWRLVRRYGWWGLAYLEAVLRLADHRQSASERG